jgi:hypothetical protein
MESETRQSTRHEDVMRLQRSFFRRLASLRLSPAFAALRTSSPGFIPVGAAWLGAATLPMILIVFAMSPGQTDGGGGAKVAAKPPAPVVIELFTSEGCSSCPPADDVMTMLVKSQPVAGAQIIALGEHVDYWDRLGWRDQFSSAQFTQRQTEYAGRVFHTDNIFTPQLIVNGEQQVVGSDARKVKQAIAKAAERPPSVTLSLTVPNTPAPDGRTPATVQVQVQATIADGAKLDEPTEVLLAVTEENLGSHVVRGENSGHDLRHGSVLRTLAPIGTMTAKDASWSMTQPITVAKDWNPRQVRLVAIAQAKNSRRILGAAIVPLVQPAQATASR